MADVQKPKPPTHTAYAMKRIGKKFRRWLEVGSGRTGEDGSFTAFIDRTPIGGWSGYIHFAPTGTQPPPLAPERPGLQAGDDEESEVSI
jgi:hypothetical protein